MSEKPTGGIDRGVLLELTTKIVSAYAGQTKVSASELLETIGAVARALSVAVRPGAEPEIKEPVMAMPIKKNGHARFPHLSRGRQETENAEAAPDARLQHDAGPVSGKVEPAARLPAGGAQYARTRSELAKKIGLGKTAPVAANQSEPNASVEEDGGEQE